MTAYGPIGIYIDDYIDDAAPEPVGRRKVTADRIELALIALYRSRVRWNPERAYVTADDVAGLHDRMVATTDATSRTWYAAIFRRPGWVFTGQFTKSTRPRNHGSDLRCWRYEL